MPLEREVLPDQAALLLGQQTRVLGLTLAGAIMIGALFTLLRNREPFQHLAPALIFSALVFDVGFLARSIRDGGQTYGLPAQPRDILS